MALIGLTRLRIRSAGYMPGLRLVHGPLSVQARRAPGFLGMQLLADRRLTFWTATAWQDVAATKAYRGSGAYAAAMRHLDDGATSESHPLAGAAGIDD